jgi:hypothetical protein
MVREKEQKSVEPKKTDRETNGLFEGFDFCVLCAADPDACFICKKESQFTTVPRKL